MHPAVRVVIWALRWPFLLPAMLYVLASALSYGLNITYEEPLRKEFYRPIFGCLWYALALIPFRLIRSNRSFAVYCLSFCAVGGWLIYDHVAPFRYVAPGFVGEIRDDGSSCVSSITGDHCNYLITRFNPSEGGSWFVIIIIVWPFVLGVIYHFLHRRRQS